VRLVAGDRGWELGSIADVPLWGMIRIEREIGLTEDGLEKLFAPLEDAAKVGGEITLTDGMVFAVGVVIWMARMCAGERIGFEDACDFPLRSIRVELTEAEQRAADEEAARLARIAEQPGVRPTVAVPVTAAE
jgi:hypothetical protein